MFTEFIKQAVAHWGAIKTESHQDFRDRLNDARVANKEVDIFVAPTFKVEGENSGAPYRAYSLHLHGIVDGSQRVTFKQELPSSIALVPFGDTQYQEVAFMRILVKAEEVQNELRASIPGANVMVGKDRDAIVTPEEWEFLHNDVRRTEAPSLVVSFTEEQPTKGCPGRRAT